MNKFFLISFCLFTNIAVSQSFEDELKLYCEELKFDDLIIYLNHLKELKLTGVEYKWQTNLEREIVDNFFEQIIQIDKELEDDISTGDKTIYSFNVDLIRSKNQIIYYELSSIKYIKKKGFHEPKNIQISKKSDKQGIYELKSSFKNTYNINLDFSDLFVTNIVYGDACGFGGSKPDYRVKLENIVQKKDKSTIIKWIKSGTVELQLYAIEGIYQLQNQGESFDTFVLDLINKIENKKGKAYTCSGCIYWDQPITKIIKRIKTEHNN